MENMQGKEKRGLRESANTEKLLRKLKFVLLRGSQEIYTAAKLLGK